MTKENTGVIYRIWNISNGMSYIGQTVNLHKRISRHLNAQSGSPYLCNAIKKYGKDKFKYEILEANVDESHLDKLEILYIRFFNSVHPYGYNLTKGGDGVRGIKHSPKYALKLVMQVETESIAPKHAPKSVWHSRERSVAPRLLLKPSKENEVTSIAPKHAPKSARETGERNIAPKHALKLAMHRGKKLSPETRAKISRGNKGKRKRKKSSPLQT